MKISLVRTGGFVPVTKKATGEVDLSEKEINDLIDLARVNEKPGNMRDNHQYQLMYNDQSYTIDLAKVPAKYRQMLEQLKDNLQIVKPK